MSLGQRLLLLRKEKDMTLREVEAKTGISASTISGAERDTREPNLVTIHALAVFYGVTLDSLADGRELSFRATSAAVRRAVLLADLEAMYTELGKSSAVEELRTSQMLIVLAYAVHNGHVMELCEAMDTVMFEWLSAKHKLAQPVTLRGLATDARDGVDVGEGAEL